MTSQIASTQNISAWTNAQYWLLRRLSPGEPTHMSGSAYANASKLRILLGDDLLERIRDRNVVDFGCGYGTEAVEMAGVARSVFGLDILESSLAVARANAARAGVEGNCTFGTTVPRDSVDTIISLDSFEHFGQPDAILNTMFDLLKPGGQVITSFGPTWYHPLGGHLFSIFPWAHLVFSEAALIRWRTDFKTDGATRFREVDGGLNQMTIGRFERLVRATRFKVVHLETVPIRRLRPLAGILPREFTTAIVRAVLEKPI
ncbi:MAG: class I SAM-dependent methyltransferase [Gemmatimonas sp.]